jgi:hypothetical protein
LSRRAVDSGDSGGGGWPRNGGRRSSKSSRGDGSSETWFREG